MDLRALAESIEKEGRLRQKWEDTYSLKQSATLSKLGLRGFTPLSEKPNAVPHPAAGQRSLEPGPHKTRPNRSTPMATPPQRNAAILQVRRTQEGARHASALLDSASRRLNQRARRACSAAAERWA